MNTFEYTYGPYTVSHDITKLTSKNMMVWTDITLIGSDTAFVFSQDILDFTSSQNYALHTRKEELFALAKVALLNYMTTIGQVAHTDEISTTYTVDLIYNPPDFYYELVERVGSRKFITRFTTDEELLHTVECVAPLDQWEIV